MESNFFFLMLLMFLVLDLKFLTQGHTYIWVYFWVWYKVEVPFHSFACGYPIVLALFVKKTITSLCWIVLDILIVPYYVNHYNFL